MPQNKITILCTGSVEKPWIKEASSKNMSLDVLPFITTKRLSSKEVQQGIEQALMLSTAVVFTSVNAVKAVAAELEEQKPDWQIFCIGHATFRSVAKYFGKKLISATAANAKDLAAIITQANVDEVIFFCGNQRRNELPDVLRENAIEVNEIMVYQTEALPHELEKKYNGILFFSPSSVQSFFQINNLEDDVVLFAIGDTTADEIRKHSQNKIIVSNRPDKQLLLQTTIKYFQTNPIHN
jgi:uroporphyrinogen-III synthase